MVLFLLSLITIFSSAYVQGIQVNAYQLHSPHIHHPFFQIPLVLCRGHFQADKVHFQVHMALVENICPIEHYSYKSMNPQIYYYFFKLSSVLVMLDWVENLYGFDPKGIYFEVHSMKFMAQS